MLPVPAVLMVSPPTPLLIACHLASIQCIPSILPSPRSWMTSTLPNPNVCIQSAYALISWLLLTLLSVDHSLLLDLGFWGSVVLTWFFSYISDHMSVWCCEKPEEFLRHRFKCIFADKPHPTVSLPVAFSAWTILHDCGMASMIHLLWVTALWFKENP